MPIAAAGILLLGWICLMQRPIWDTREESTVSGHATAGDPKPAPEHQMHDDSRINGVSGDHAQMANVRGVARDEGGRPIAGVTVRSYTSMMMYGSGNITGLGNSAVTDSAGRFAFRQQDGRLDGVVVIPTVKNPWQGREGMFDALDDFDLVLRPASSLSGKVVNSKGDPVSGVEVQVEACDGRGLRLLLCAAPADGPSTGTVTGSDGKFTFEALPECIALLRVRAEGLRLASEHSVEGAVVEPGKDVTGVVLTLEPDDEQELTGRLVDTEGHALTRWLVRSGDPMNHLEGQLTSADGSFRYWISSRHREVEFWDDPGYPFGDASDGHYQARYRTGKVDLSAGEPGDGRVFVAPEWASVSGRLVERGTGKPVPGARIILSSAEAHPDVSLPFSQLQMISFWATPNGGTDPDGSFRFERIPSGDYGLMVDPWSFSGGGETILSVRQGEEVNLGDILIVPSPTPELGH